MTALVLCGGASARHGGVDKTAQDLGGSSVLGRLVAALPDGWPIVCVGTPRPLPCPVDWTCEDPPRGGPVAGIAAGLLLVDSRVTLLLAGDLPFAGPLAADLGDALARAPGDVDGVQALDVDGEGQVLLAAYRTAALRAVIPADPGRARGRGVHRVLRTLRVKTRPVPAEAAWDLDTPADLSRARQWLAGPPDQPLNRPPTAGRDRWPGEGVGPPRSPGAPRVGP